MNASTLPADLSERALGESWWKRHREEILIALLLMLASHFFVSCFAKLPQWEQHLPDFKRGDYCRWDCGWFSTVEHFGYEATPRFGDQASWHFLPLFPLSAYPAIHVMKMDPARASVLMSKFFLFTAIWSFLWMMGGEGLGFRDKLLAGTLVAFNPYLLYAHVGYSEPLYFTLAACAFAALNRERWIASGLAGGLLSATRVQGVIFTVAYFVGCVRRFGPVGLLRQRNLNVWLGLVLCPVGLSLYLLYLYRLTGDALAPMHSFVAWGLKTGNPIEVLLGSIRAGGWMRYWAGTAVVGFLVGVWLAFQRKFEMAVFLMLCIIMPVTAEVAGMPRFVWWQPPMLYSVYRMLHRFPYLRMIYAVFAGGMAAVSIYLWMLWSPAFL